MYMLLKMVFRYFNRSDQLTPFKRIVFLRCITRETMKILKCNAAFAFLSHYYYCCIQCNQCNAHITWMNGYARFRCAEDRVHSVVTFQSTASRTRLSFIAWKIGVVKVRTT